MKTCLWMPLFLVCLGVALSCSRDDFPDYYIGKKNTNANTLYIHPEDSLWVRHHDTPLKILAIGNSFTNNASFYLPWLIEKLDGDSICFAKLTRSGCSLGMHWTSHVYGTPDYDLYYTDGGKWIKSEIKVFDDALCLMDWDIITLQQASAYSGVWSSYQPALDYLSRLIYESHPNARLAWHYTWAYRQGTQNEGFAHYGYDAETMYRAIMEAGDLASEGMDMKLPSATLIRDMRKAYPEVSNQFSEDGLHLSDDMALFALSLLWHDTLISPTTGTSSIWNPIYISMIDVRRFERALQILQGMFPKNEPESSVPEVHI